MAIPNKKTKRPQTSKPMVLARRADLSMQHTPETSELAGSHEDDNIDKNGESAAAAENRKLQERLTALEMRFEESQSAQSSPKKKHINDPVVIKGAPLPDSKGNLGRSSKKDLHESDLSKAEYSLKPSGDGMKLVRRGRLILKFGKDEWEGYQTAGTLTMKAFTKEYGSAIKSSLNVATSDATVATGGTDYLNSILPLFDSYYTHAKDAKARAVAVDSALRKDTQGKFVKAEEAGTPDKAQWTKAVDIRLKALKGWRAAIDSSIVDLHNIYTSLEEGKDVGPLPPYWLYVDNDQQYSGSMVNTLIQDIHSVSEQARVKLTTRDVYLRKLEVAMEQKLSMLGALYEAISTSMDNGAKAQPNNWLLYLLDPEAKAIPGTLKRSPNADGESGPAQKKSRLVAKKSDAKSTTEMVPKVKTTPSRPETTIRVNEDDNDEDEDVDGNPSQDDNEDDDDVDNED